jgi:hypothetical protein
MLCRRGIEDVEDDHIGPGAGGEIDQRASREH